MIKLTGDQLKAYNEYVRKPFYEARFKDENGNIFARKTDDPEDIRFDSPDQVDLSQLHDSAVVEDSRAKKHTAPESSSTSPACPLSSQSRGSSRQMS